MANQTWVQVVTNSQVDGSALTAAAAASMLPAQAKYTFPQNYFSDIGQMVHVRASGRYSVVITTPGTLRFDLRLGGTVIFDSLAIALDSSAAYTNVGWYLDVLLTVRAVGSAGNFMGQGTLVATGIAGQIATPPKGALTAILPWNSAPAVGNNVDFTTALQLDAFFTQTVATGSMTCHQYVAETLN